MKRSIFKKGIILALLAAGSLFAYGQVEDPVQWSILSKKIENNKYELVVTATIEQGWHLYSTKLPEGGPLPTSFKFAESKDYKLVEGVKELTKPKTEHDDIFNLDLSFFEGEAQFGQIVDLAGDEASINLTVEYQACYADKCIYLEKDLSHKLGKNGSAVYTGEEVQLVKAAPATIAPTKDESAEKTSSSLWVFFFLSFAAGLAGLLTPCVFPMIPMTVSFFMGKQGNRMNAILNAIVFGLSIIVIYTSLGLLVSLFNLGPDFTTTLTTHWITNLIFFLLFIAFAASFFGLFEIVLPGSVANKTDSKADKGGFTGSFFMALTTVIVSLSCVGPIVGALLVEAASGLGAKPIVGMFGFSLAFSIPFTLFAIFPSWLKSLPRSGGWMNSVKVVLGFIVLAFSLKFLLTIDQSYNLNFLSRDIYLAIWIVIFTLVGLYLLGKIKFKFDSDLQHVGVLRLFLAITSFTFVVYLIPGMFGAPLKAISGLIPPQSSQKFSLNQSSQVVMPTVNDNTSLSLCDQPKFADIFKLPYNLKGYFDYNQALECARKLGKPIFVDFVGHTCANCKDMEARVWSDPRVLERLSSSYIIVALYVDDRTELPENEWVTSTRDGKIKKTIGKKNADFQATRFNVNGQPYYVLLGTNEQVLTEPMGYNTNVEEFVAFLDKGVKEFKKSTTGE